MIAVETFYRTGALSAAVVFATACAERDNPMALADLNPAVEFEVEATEVQTFEEVELHVHVTESGAPLRMLHSELEIEHAHSGETYVVDMTPHEDGYEAHVTFFRAGEHHLHFGGTPEGHSLSAEMGAMEVDVENRHQIIGPYLVELSVSPVPQAGITGHVHVGVFDLVGGEKGAPVGGLELHLEMVPPGGGHAHVEVAEEEPGTYEGEYLFGDSGPYELHVEIEAAAGTLEGEFHIPLFEDSHDDADDGTGGGDQQGGGGHDHA